MISKDDADKVKEIRCSITELNSPYIKIKSVRFECPNCGSILKVDQIDEKYREPSRCSCGWKKSFSELSKEEIEAQDIIVTEQSTLEMFKVYLEGKELLNKVKSTIGNGVFTLRGLVQIEYKKRSNKGRIVILAEDIN
jgi:predicted RNA-binding Zn-ribbon protein involved in translation (DUF1610 family)